MIDKLKVLKKYWKYNAFREPQGAIIDTVLENKDVFALLPTGAGKSICFQVPALLLEGVCVVISPLIALMQDQVDNLKKRGIKAAMLSSALGQNEIVNLFDNLQYGGYKFLYLSPERLQSEFIQEKLKQLDINIIAIDEAHCISEWGHDFRPSYRKINVLTELCPNATVIALTASATKRVIKDIVTNLRLKEAVQFRTTLKRPELHYKVLHTNNIRLTIKDLVSNDAPSIVYTTSRKATKAISSYLNNNKYRSSFYHGGLTAIEKQEAYTAWLSEKTPIMIATNAFGMGIDKENVSGIIHANLPFSIESYIQESGRAGRNGVQSLACLLYNEATLAEFDTHFKKAIVPLNFLKEVYRKLNQYYTIAIGEQSLEPLQFNLAQFCDNYSLPYLKTFNTISILEKEGIIELSNNLNKKSSLKFIISQQLFFQYVKTNKQLDTLTKTLLRTYGGSFEQYIKIDEFLLSKKTQLDKSLIVQLLNQLHNDKVIDYKPIMSDHSILFLVPREDSYTINRISANVKQRNKIMLEKREAVLAYVRNEKTCRSKLLLEYFGEKQIKDCGTCDICTLKNKKTKISNFKTISDDILKLLIAKPLTSKELVMLLENDKNVVLTTLQLLLEKNKITITSQNKFQLK